MRRHASSVSIWSLALLLAGESFAVTLLPPIITKPPQDRTVNQGITATFRVEANGYPPLYYQWRKNGLPVPLGTNLFLSVPGSNAPSALYDVVVTNYYGAVTSAPASLTVRIQEPGITTEPVSQVACTGSSITFTSSAGGIGPFTFRWLLGGNPVTSPSSNGLLRLTNITTANAGDYRVLVTNLYGTVTSAVATLTVDSPTPVIITQPRSQVGYVGNSVVLSVQAVSCSLTSYQWRSNSVSLPSATNNSLAIYPLRADLTADYDVVVTNQSGSVTSQLAILVVTNRPPVLTCQPQSKTVGAGTPVIFSVCVSSPLSYSVRWLHDGQPIAGSLSNNLILANVWTNDAGGYWCVVTNSEGSVTSEVATLTVTTSAPVITQQPQSMSVDAGSTAHLTVGTTGAPAPRFQWFFNGQALLGATAATLDLYSVSTNQSGNYLVVASNIFGVVTSDVAVVTVLLRPPSIMLDPQSLTVNAGSTAIFSVSADGSAPLSYQWQRNGQNVSGSGSASLYLYSVTYNQAGDYRVVVSNPYGAVTSAVAQLTVLVQPPVITTPPQNQPADLGTYAYFYVGASGTSPFFYQWQRNGQNLPGATSYYYSPLINSTNQAGDYRVIVSNVGGSVTSTVASLTVLTRPPRIVSPPQNQTVEAGGYAYFTASVEGARPFAYQWQWNGQNLSNATDSYLSLYTTSTNDSGDYRLVVTNIFGAATSAVARLTVLAYPPQIYQQPWGVSADADAQPLLYVGVSGTSPLSFQWRRNGFDVPGATGSILSFFPFAPSDAGSYQVVVSNMAGIVTSEVASVTMNLHAPIFSQHPVSQTVDAGTTIFLDSSLTGSPRPSFHWQRNGQDLPGATNFTWSSSSQNAYYSASLKLDSVTSADVGGYRLIASNSVGTATSAVATVGVTYRAPLFVSLPTSYTVWAGNYSYLSCTVAGGPPPTLQWFFNNQLIPGATNSVLLFLVTSTNQAGDYTVMASNVFGTVTSPPATLSVMISAPVFSVHPLSQSLVVGQSLQLSVTAYGNPAPSYQWLFNGQAIPTATNEIFYIEEAVTNHTGDYSAIAANEGGAVTSTVARVVIGPAGPLDRWQWRNPLPQGNDLYCVASGNGVWVALGRGGARIRSTDGGATWQNQHQGESDIRSVAFGNGVFVAAGYGWRATHYVSWLQSSRDGLQWTNHYAGLLDNETIEAVAFGNGRFVAVSGSGAAFTSTNGTNWTRTEGVSPNGLIKVTFGQGLFVALTGAYQYGTNGATAYYATSADGVTWDSRMVNVPGYVSDITFGDGKFVLCGYSNYSTYPPPAVALVSQDGATWASYAMPTNAYLSAIGFGGGRFVTVSWDGSGTIMSSTDGTNWTASNTGLWNELMGVACDQGHCVTVGDKGAIFTSTNGVAWTARSPGSGTNLRCITHGPGLYVAVGNEGLTWTSPDGLTWTRRQAPTTSNLRSVAFGSDRYVAVGEISESEALVLTSTNGIDWTGANSPLGYGIYSIAYGGGQFVAVGFDGVIVTSPDGRIWSSRQSNTTRRLNAVTYGAGQYVAVGRNGTVLTSSDGAQWFVEASPTGYFLQGVAYGNGLYVAAGQGGEVIVSTNGTQWSKPYATSSPLSYSSVEDVQFANGNFIATGSDGLIATSSNGVVWTQHRTGSQNTFRSSCYADGYVIAVGNNETILQSDYFGPARLRVRSVRGGEGFEFYVDGEVGCQYVLQASDDLEHWEDVFTFANTRVTTFFVEPDADLMHKRFYRVIAP